MHMLKSIVSFVFCLLATYIRAQVPTYAPSDNLLAWYNFSGDASDASGNGHHGAAFNISSTTDRQGQSGQAFYFDGATSDIAVPYAPAFNAFPLTISLWVRTESDENGGMIIRHYTNSSWNGWVVSVTGSSGTTQTVAPGYMLQAPPNCNGVVSSVNCDTGINYSGEVNDNFWHMLTFTVDGDSGRFYFDGLLQTTQAWSGTPGAPDNTDALHIGSSDIGPEFMFHGAIDEVGLWNRALNAGEIETLFLGMPPTAGCMNSNACNYTPEAVVDDGSCTFNCAGCIDPCACNYNQNAVYSDGSCDYTCNVAMSFISVFHDANGNGSYDNSEHAMQYWPVRIEELDKIVYTDGNGMIMVSLPAGSIHYTLVNNTSNWVSTTPETQAVDIPGPTMASFGLRELVPSVQIHAALLETFYQNIHCEHGFESGLYLRNKGSVALHGALTLTCDELFSPLEATSLSTPPDSTAAGYARWELTEVAPWQTALLSYGIAGPGEAFAQQSFVFSLHLELYDLDGNLALDTLFEIAPVVSCDPEQTRLIPEPLGITDTYRYVNAGSNVTLRVHFQNTTEGTVQDALVIQNLNSQQYITDSFELLYTSEAALGCLHDDGTIDLSFRDLQLPPASDNPFDASVFAVYSARLRSDIPFDSTFYHEAYVVFDWDQTVLIDSMHHTIFDCGQLPGIMGDFVFCEGDSVYLHAEGDTTLNYRWYIEDDFMAIGPSLASVLQAGEYQVQLHVEHPLCIANDTKSVTVYPLPEGEIIWTDSMLIINANYSCQWYFNGGLLPGAVGQQLVPAEDGVYRVHMVGAGGCSGWSQEFVVSGLEELETYLNIYPNPASIVCFAELPVGMDELRLIDSRGAVIWQSATVQSKVRIDVSQFASGLYLLCASGKGGTIHRTLVVN